MTASSDLRPDLATRADELLHTRPNADQLAGMTTHAFEASGLDHDTLMLVWLAALRPAAGVQRTAPRSRACRGRSATCWQGV